jgi:hypothetical protein
VRIEILPRAREDIVAGYRFYEQQEQGLGDYFRGTIFAAVEALRVSGGVHAKQHGYYRANARPFPFAIYYRVFDNVVYVHAVFDSRRDPNAIERTLRHR